MGELGQYAGSVIVAAVICAIIAELTKNSGTKKLIRLISGLFLAFAVLNPLHKADFSKLSIPTETFSHRAEDITRDGNKRYRESLCAIIKNETEAYILDKANEMNADITVAVQVSSESPHIPVSAEIVGSVAPYTQQKIVQLLQEHLGITKENQKWILQE